MSEHDTQFDDELLSAYLDDELAPEQRTRVERRLDTDPATRKLLDELRAVSQATRELPAEKFDADLRDTILRRAERAILLSPTGEPASAGGAAAQTPSAKSTFTVGRSRRAWLWAGAAVAAALMLMVIQQEPEQDENLPTNVAARSDDTRRDSTVAPADRLEMRTLTEDDDSPTPDGSSPPLATTDVAPAEQPLSVTMEAADSPDASDAPRAGVPAAGSAVADDRLDTSGRGALSDADVATSSREQPSRAPTVASGRENFSGGVGGSAPAANQQGDANEQDWVIVHLRCSSTTIEQKVLDQTLIKNNIDVEDSAAAVDETLAERSAPSPQSGSRSSSSGRVAFNSQMEPPGEAEHFAEESPPVEVVAVEADPAQLYGCMQDIEADNKNFLGIAVEEPVAVTATPEATDEGGLNLQQYNRGLVPQQQKFRRSATNYFVYESEQGPTVLSTPDFAEPTAPHGQMTARDVSGGQQRGRAWRVRGLETEESELSPDVARVAKLRDAESSDKAQSSPASSTWGHAQRKLSALARTKADMMQVLFVLHPDDRPASSTPSSETQGLQKAD